MTETYTDDEGAERCDNCDEEAHECACVCPECGDSLQDCGGDCVFEEGVVWVGVPDQRDEA